VRLQVGLHTSSQTPPSMPDECLAASSALDSAGCRGAITKASCDVGTEAASLIRYRGGGDGEKGARGRRVGVEEGEVVAVELIQTRNASWLVLRLNASIYACTPRRPSSWRHDVHHRAPRESRRGQRTNDSR